MSKYISTDLQRCTGCTTLCWTCKCNIFRGHNCQSDAAFCHNWKPHHSLGKILVAVWPESFVEFISDMISCAIHLLSWDFNRFQFRHFGTLWLGSSSGQRYKQPEQLRSRQPMRHQQQSAQHHWARTSNPLQPGKKKAIKTFPLEAIENHTLNPGWGKSSSLKASNLSMVECTVELGKLVGWTGAGR